MISSLSAVCVHFVWKLITEYLGVALGVLSLKHKRTITHCTHTHSLEGESRDRGEKTKIFYYYFARTGLLGLELRYLSSIIGDQVDAM